MLIDIQVHTERCHHAEGDITDLLNFLRLNKISLAYFEKGKKAEVKL